MSSLRSTHGYDAVDLQSPNPDARAFDKTQLNVHFQSPPLYPPSGSQTPPKTVNYVRTPGDNTGGSNQRYDIEQAQPLYEGLPETSEKPGNSRNSSWDIYSRIKKIEHSYEEFDARNGTQAHPVYAEGDASKTQVSGLNCSLEAACLSLLRSRSCTITC
jgi:hypothetical protein